MGLSVLATDLAKYAVIGGGPPFRKAGRYPLYDPSDLDCWISDKLTEPVLSTSALIRGTLHMSDIIIEQRKKSWK
jgi:hypothetical protein